MLIDEYIHFGGIVLLKFPFTDESSFKRRPALIIQDSRDGDIIVCRITSQIYYSDYDLLIKEWQKSGLKLPSVIRIHKIATLNKNLIEFKMGNISSTLKGRIKEVIAKITE